MKYRLYLIVIIISFLSNQGFAQISGIQFNTGFGKPIVIFDAPNSSVSYQSEMNNDTRIGVYIGKYDKVSVAFLLGLFNVNANYLNIDGLATEFKSSNLVIDLPMRYAYQAGLIKSISIGPCMYLMMNSSQSINGKPVFNDKVFNSINWGLGAELNFKGYESKSLCLSPYINYKQMLSSADAVNDNESLKMHSISIGVKVDILLQ